MILVTSAGVLAANLLIYLLGRAAGGAFTYTQSGKATTVDALTVAVMSVGPITTGLTLIAWLSRRWPALITAAQVVGPAMAVTTIAVMTIPVGFDTPAPSPSPRCTSLSYPRW